MRHLLLLFAVACATEPDPTRWDSAAEVCDAGCARLHECHPTWDARACSFACVAELCSREAYCDAPPGHPERVEACALAMTTLSCTASVFPEPCAYVLD